MAAWGTFYKYSLTGYMAFSGLCKFTRLAPSGSLCVSAALRDDPCAPAWLWFSLRHGPLFSLNKADISNVGQKILPATPRPFVQNQKSNNYGLLSFQPSFQGQESVMQICRMSKLKIKIALKTLTSNTAFQGAGPSSRSLTSPHFYSLSKRACRIPLQVQLTKTIQMPHFFWCLTQVNTLPLPSWFAATSLVPPSRKWSWQNSSILRHMLRISIRWNNLLLANNINNDQSQII